MEQDEDWQGADRCYLILDQATPLESSQSKDCGGRVNGFEGINVDAFTPLDPQLRLTRATVYHGAVCGDTTDA